MKDSLSDDKRKELVSWVKGLFSFEKDQVQQICTEFEGLIADQILEDQDPLLEHILFTLAQYYGMSRRLDKSKHFVNLAIELGTRQKNKDILLRARSNLAIINFEQGQYYEAIEEWENMIASTDSPRLICSCYQNLARAFTISAKEEEAMKCCYRAIEMLQDIGDEEALANSYNSLGNLFRELHKTDKALDYFEKSRTIYEKIDNKQRLAMIYNNLCLVYIDSGDYDNALTIGTDALDYVLKYCPEVEHTHIMNNLGLVHINKKNPDQAREFFNRTLAIATKYEDNWVVSNTMNNLARLDLMAGNPSQAIATAKESLSIQVKLPVASHESASYDILHQACLALGDYKQAYEYLLSKEKILEARYANFPDVTIAHAEADYLKRKIESQSESYRLQNVELNKSNLLISEQAQKLETANSELRSTNSLFKRLVSIIAHDVRGPVSSFAQALELMETGDLPDDEQKNLLHELKIGAEHTSDMLSALLNQIRDYKSKELASTQTIDLNALLSEVTAIFFTSARQKNIQLCFCPTPQPIIINNHPSALKLIFRNLINNAIKFTPNGGQIHIELSQSDSETTIRISDTGVGMNNTTIQKILDGVAVTTPGTASEKGFGLGLIFTLDCIRQSGARLEIDSEPGKGSTFTLRY